MFDPSHHENFTGAIELAPFPPAKKPRLVSLFRYLAARGGLKPHPDLRYVLDGNPVVPGNGRLIRARGLSLHKAWEAACEGGYIFDPGWHSEHAPLVTTEHDLLDLIRDEAHGQLQYPVGSAPREREPDEAELVYRREQELETAAELGGSAATGLVRASDAANLRGSNPLRQQRGTSMAKPAKKAANGGFKSMTPAEYKKLREKLGLSNYAIGPALKFSETPDAARRQARRFEAGETDIPAPVATLLRAMVRHGIAPEELD